MVPEARPVFNAEAGVAVATDDRGHRGGIRAATPHGAPPHVQYSSRAAGSRSATARSRWERSSRMVAAG